MKNKKEFKKLEEKGQIQELKNLVRLTFKAFMWINIFLLIPTITLYITEIKLLQYARDLGILILTILLIRTNYALKKNKEKEEEQ